LLLSKWNGVNICSWDKAGGSVSTTLNNGAGGKKVLASFIFINMVMFFSTDLLNSDEASIDREFFTASVFMYLQVLSQVCKNYGLLNLVSSAKARKVT
jgi:hypothetical protein